MFGHLKKEVFYPYSLQRVWQVLTNQKALAAWLMENDFEARVGHKFQFIYSSLPGMSAYINCEVIELDEPRRLSFTWKDSLMCQPSIVTWTLEAVDAGTVLRLEHRIIENIFTGLNHSQKREDYNWLSNNSSPSASLNRQLGVLALTPSYGSLNNSFEKPISIILNAYFNGGWEYKFNHNLPEELNKYSDVD
jgi:uncharacterized protein YndB with AHSA1/START domain